MKWLLARFKEPSTWRGLVWLATVFGLSLRPDQAEAIVSVGMAVAGLLGVFLNDAPTNSANSDFSVNTSNSTSFDPNSYSSEELPNIELVGKSMGETGRNNQMDHGMDHRRTVFNHGSDQLRQSVSSNRRSNQATTSDSNTQSFGSGFGDRD